MKTKINIRFQNGLDFEHFKRDVFDVNKVSEKFDFVESENPDFIVFGPYGNDIPTKGNYIRIGYFCENITPDFSNCEWAFGIPIEEKINHSKYKRIQWHGQLPGKLIKNLSDKDIDQILTEKTKFCNFLYSNKVPYREEFFRQLSNYKKIDAPGKSMNNMPSIDTLYDGDIWERKRKFLHPYKFTIAFENYSFPGYQTEKLYDAMLANSIPIYCGDSNINEIFNPGSFINLSDYVEPNNNAIISFLEKSSQQNFIDYRPHFFDNPIQKTRRKLKSIGRQLKMKYKFNGLDFSPLIDRIIEIDRNQDLYESYLKEPFFKNNTVSNHFLSAAQWTKIFHSRL